ncbi:MULTISPECIES: hypothetical protein [unclassified Nocardiopsis]|uniref:hypothetical protein n=1 Tax=unclassified Nocardiopsis TaxID=2649073 RepID=UPI00135A4CFA|nr:MULTISPECIES: hypothetical protein [unclassified Nocardiopsis]
MLIAAHDPSDRDHRLSRLGTSWPVLETAIRRGEAGWRGATPDHGGDAAAQYAYRERLAALRAGQKVHHGWGNARLFQIELTVNPGHTVAFQTLSGDHRTGNPNLTPRTKTPRGPNGRLLLSGGEEDDQPSLFPDLLPQPVPDTAELTDPAGLAVWILLVHREAVAQDGSVLWHSELSLPRPPDERGYITGWLDRVTLPPVVFDAVVFPDEEEGPDGIDIPVGAR